MKLDVRDVGGLLERVGEADAVVDLVASKIPRYQSALTTLTLNTEATRAGLELARRRGALFVLASTSDVYGLWDGPMSEDGNLVLGPTSSRRWAYAASKIWCEHLCYAYWDEYRVPFVILRFFGTYGPRQYLSWWGGPQGVFVRALLLGEPMPIHGDGSQRRCFIYVEEAALAAALALERPEARGEVINIGTREEVSILELARLVHETGGFPGEPRVEFVPYESFTPGYQDVPRKLPDVSKMERLLGVRPRVSLREGLTKLWDWVRREVVPLLTPGPQPPSSSK